MKRIIKRRVALSLAIVLIVLQLPGSLVYAAESNENQELSSNQISEDTAEEIQKQVFVINSVNDFLAFAENCRRNSWSEDQKVELAHDLSLEHIEFEGIPSFSGTFDGNGYTISHVSISEGDEATGFIRYLEKDGEVKNLTVSGIIGSSDSRDYLGGIVGVNSGKIDNCKFVGTITGLDVTGGIAGLNGGAGRIRDCVNEGHITSQTNVGGIAGINRGYISDCVNSGGINNDSSWVDGASEDENNNTLNILKGMVESGKNIGGIVGWSNGIVASCENEGIVGYLKSGENIGGIVGLQSGIILDSDNDGKVYGKQDVGGICGQFVPTVVIENMAEIRGELDNLHDILASSTDDMDVASDVLTGDVDKISDDADKVTESLDNVSNEATDVVEADIDEVNDVSDRIDYVSKHLEDVNTNISNVMDETDDLNDVLDRMEEDVQLSDKEKDSLKKARKGIDTSSDKLSKNLEEASKYVSDAEAIVVSANEAGEREEEEYKASHPSATDEDLQKARRKGMSRYISDYSADLDVDLAYALEYFTAAFKDMSDILSYMSDVYDVIGPYLDDASSDLDKDWDKASSITNAMSDNLQSASDGTEGILDYINSLEKIEFINFSDNFDSNMTNLQNEVDSTLDSMDRLNSDVSIHTDIIEEDIRRINDQMQVVSDLLVDRYDSLDDITNGKDIIIDVSEENDNSENCACITGCHNTGTIDGNTNLGGIVGDIGLDTSDETEKGIGSKYKVAAVVKNCNNSGFVTAKNKYAGGILGYADAGLVTNCQSSGGVFGEDADYLGGIAGYCLGVIRNCNSLIVLSGHDYLGGIAGVGDDVYDCLAMPYFMKYDGRVGAILGAYSADDDDITVFHQSMNEHINNNYFESDELYGIDRVSYAGVAEPVTYDELIDKSYIFKHLRIYFVDEDYNYISDQEKKYDSDFSDLHYPSIEMEKETYAEWDYPKSKTLKSNIVLRSEVVDNITVLGSDMKYEGKAVVLAEGVFTKEAKLNVTESDVEYDGIVRDSTIVEAYDIELVNANVDSSQISSIRILQKLEGNMKLYVYEDGKWEEIKGEQTGKYTEIEMSGDKLTVCTITVLDKEMHVYHVIGIVVLVLFLVLSVLLLNKAVSKRKKRKAAKAENANNEAAAENVTDNEAETDSEK